jgi:kinesin family protein 2/24
VLVKGLSSHQASSPDELARLVRVAQSRRSTAATERNGASSRSHGIAIINIGQPGSAAAAGGGKGWAGANQTLSLSRDDGPDTAPTDGVLYVIDLAGSERAADSAGHSKERMSETKQINLSLMALKECIRARTLASAPGAGQKLHVPFRR